MQDKIADIKNTYLKKIKQASSLKELDEHFLALFGKKGAVTKLPKEFSKLSKDQLQLVSPLFNGVKFELEKAISNKRLTIRETGYSLLERESLDLSSPVEIKKRQGALNPLTEFENHIVQVFSKLGFQQYDAPQIDTDINNFQVLNIPENHPARDLQDTFYIDSTNFGIEPGRILMRTHTSNSQIRIMTEYPAPVRFMNIGRCFRNESTDARHEHTFDQFELVYIDKGLSLANLLYLSEYFLKAVFGPEIKARLRPKYYPFVEPGAGVDGLCIFCSGKGCNICGGGGWLELGGAGMIHPNVLRAGGINPNEYSGIAWGCSPERMTMLKQGISDMRQLRNGDLRLFESLGSSVKV
ncbi:phenylalanine--tRNA ligase subunit alpha [Candidatus Daviesbacteria bacterium RIFCSPHIGHO2_01_FULL_44_29]|nr:MAG: phenylalanine--tRNA ligase subunit alpha [Candidatus Daviesbacteria bacterium RIFCSPHIGHO2_01_FULL_44_29]